MMFAGFRSRWTTPASCAATSPPTTERAMRSTRGPAACRRVLENRREVGALDVRHRDVLDAVDLAEVVNADDVLVGDLTRQQQLALEAPLDLGGRRRIRHHLRTDDFDRDGDAQLGVPRLVHGAHPADAEQADDVIAGAERLADRQRALLLGLWSSAPRPCACRRARPRGNRQRFIDDGVDDLAASGRWRPGRRPSCAAPAGSSDAMSLERS